MVSSWHFRGKEPAREALEEEPALWQHATISASARVRSASAPRLAKREHPAAFRCQIATKFSLQCPNSLPFRCQKLPILEAFSCILVHFGAYRKIVSRSCIHADLMVFQSGDPNGIDFGQRPHPSGNHGVIVCLASLGSN